MGNPIGGNVTSTANGGDTSYEEWMSFMSYNEFCLRICTNEGQWSAGEMCAHELDLMGCQWVMPGDYSRNSFTECDGDAAYPPGVYPQADGSYSTFRQRYTGSYWDNGELHYWTVGQVSAAARTETSPRENVTDSCRPLLLPVPPRFPPLGTARRTRPSPTV